MIIQYDVYYIRFLNDNYRLTADDLIKKKFYMQIQEKFKKLQGVAGRANNRKIRL